jgi:hypothetical protein
VYSLFKFNKSEKIQKEIVMSSVTISNVVYYLNGSSYVVGNGATNGGISDPSYSGEITIQERVNGKDVTEISKKAFNTCKAITKVFIYAKISKIGYGAFCWCEKLQYINIPSTVILLDGESLYFGRISSQTMYDLPVTVEFEPGRTSSLYIGRACFGCRSYYYIIYPSNIVPTYVNDGNYYASGTVYICAPSQFDFYTKQTTTDRSKCPASLNINPIEKKIKWSCQCNTRILSSTMLSFLVIFLSHSFDNIATPKIIRS